MANKTSKVLHFDRLKLATVKPRVHNLSTSELDFSASSAEEEDLPDYIAINQQPAKPVNAKIDAAKTQAPLEKQNARVVTSGKRKPAQHPPKAAAKSNVEVVPVAKQGTPKLEAATVAKQTTHAKQEKLERSPRLAIAPLFAPKVDKAKMVEPKPAAPLLASEHPTRISKVLTQKYRHRR